ncbi:MAG: polyprenyl synthetase family protein [Oligoflexia bacterium]|nr:polyprenyl synthetase family protein [Oligoflexia bacterium]
MSLDLKIKNYKALIETEVQNYIEAIKPKVENTGLIGLHRAISYSLSSGGGRLRPILCCLVAEYLKADVKKVLPFALALELVHTYSLIHDDLPAMDNDNFRRGKPSTHRAFSEALAILSGDALNTEAYRIIALHYKEDPTLALELIELLSEKSALTGMIGGQAIDMASKNEKLNLHDLEFLHKNKTASLFEAAVIGSALISKASNEKAHQLKNYAQVLGLLFQATDDLADQPKRDEPGVISVLGLEKAKEYCQNLTLQAQSFVDGVLWDFVTVVTKR